MTDERKDEKAEETTEQPRKRYYGGAGHFGGGQHFGERKDDGRDKQD